MLPSAITPLKVRGRTFFIKRDDLIDPLFRITSYNVCYTKLLRAASARVTCNTQPLQSVEVIENASRIIEMLRNAPHGVISRDKSGAPLSSINLAIVSIENARLEVHLSARGMRRDALETVITSYSIHYTKLYD